MLPVLAGALYACLMATVGSPEMAPGVSAFHLRSTQRSNLLIFGRLATTSEDWTCADRRAVDAVGFSFSAMGPDSSRVHSRIITRLDRRVIWHVDYADSSYTEEPLRNAPQVERLRDSLSAAAPGPKWHFTLGIPKTMGTPERVRGMLTTHTLREDRAGNNTGMLRRMEWWEARDVAGMGMYAQFWRSLNSLWHEASDGTPHAAAPSSSSAVEPRDAYDLGTLAGIPLRMTVRLVFPELAGAADSSGALDRDSRAMGFDPGMRSWVSLQMDVEQFGLVTVSGDVFELPRGFRRRASDEERMLEYLRSASAADSSREAPGR